MAQHFRFFFTECYHNDLSFFFLLKVMTLLNLLGQSFFLETWKTPYYYSDVFIILL